MLDQLTVKSRHPGCALTLVTPLAAELEFCSTVCSDDDDDEPNHVSSVFTAFNCSRDPHQLATSDSDTCIVL